MTLHYTKYKENYKKFILSTIDSDINGKPIKKDIDKINYIFKRFYSEYGFFIPKIGKQKALAEWLSGLALDLPYYYNDIVELAIKMGSINPNPSDSLRNKVEQGYWDFMANIILDMEKELESV
tara:strand:+ start:1589 stop:1957 length:369 start_codon:yes stop_codon:yes gene_type:complete